MLWDLICFPFKLVGEIVGWALKLTGHILGFVLGLLMVVGGIALCLTLIGLIVGIPMVLLGAAAPFIDLEAEKIEEGIRSVFGAKGDKIVDMNITAFRAGLKLTRELLEKRK